MANASRPGERRRQRESFTRTLKRICERLDIKSAAEVQYLCRSTHWQQSGHFRLTRLWVAGSYARGALTCGDLDLVAELGDTSGSFGRAQVNRSLFGKPPNVSVHLGTPEENSSHARLSDAVLIWDGSGCDWHQRIDAIVPAPDAGRMARPTDQIPLRREQLSIELTNTGSDTYATVLALKEKNVFRWTFTPLDDVMAVAPDGDNEQRFADYVARNCGRKTQSLVPLLIGYSRRSTAWPKRYWQWDFGERTQFRLGGADLLVGQPVIAYYLLDHLATSQVILVPHVTSRGPNGIWTIERGDAHPLVCQFEGAYAYCLVDPAGLPYLSLNGELPRGYRHANGVVGLELFLSERGAEIYAQKQHGVRLTARRLVSPDLLECLSQVDVVSVDSIPYALTDHGQAALGVVGVASPENVLGVLGASSRCTV